MFRIFDADKPTTDVYLKLENGGDVVILRVVDVGGKNVTNGVLMTFLPNGTYRRNGYIGKDVGIERDSNQKIMEVS